MNRQRAAVFGLLLLCPLTAIASAFTDAVRFDSRKDVDSEAVTFIISPPLLISEASWPLCWTLRLRVPLKPNFRSVTLDEHQKALSRLLEASRNNEKMHFGPAGRGLIRSQNDRCVLISKAVRMIFREDGIEAVTSFHD